MRRSRLLAGFAHGVVVATLIACAGGTATVIEVPTPIDGGTVVPDASHADADPAFGEDASAGSDAADSAPSPDASPDASRDGAACVPSAPLVCGRGVNGIACGAAKSASFGALGVWQADFSDAAGWNASAATYGTIQFPDVDGDGKSDVCGRGVAGLACALSNGASFGAFGALGTSLYNDASGWGGSAAYYGTIQFADINGDGKSDVCGRGIGGIYCALSAGTSFGSFDVWQSAFSDADGWNAPGYYATVQFVDVNGDGKADVCGRGAGGLACALSTGAAFATTATLQTTWFNDASGWGASAAYYATIQFADVNGDKKADVCGRGVGGIYCSLSAGTSFGSFDLWQPDFSDANGWKAGPAYYATIQFPDVNGDGKADVCGRAAAGLACALSSGTAFGAFGALQTALFDDASGWGGDRGYWGTIQFPDVNGDGKADVCARGVGGVDCALSAGTSFGTFGIWQSEFSDASGWTALAYATTIRFPLAAAGTCSPRALATPPPSPAARFGL